MQLIKNYGSFAACFIFYDLLGKSDSMSVAILNALRHQALNAFFNFDLP